MKNEEIEEEKKDDWEFKRVSSQQKKIEREFTSLLECDHKEFNANFVRAQAKEICKYMYRLKFTPFKSWESALKLLIDCKDSDFMYQNFLIKNEFGEFEPDEERIKELILKEPDVEEFPVSRTQE